MLKKFQKLLTLALVPFVLWVSLSACTPQPPSRFEQAQQESTQRGATAVVKESSQGAKFNAFFPPVEGDYKRIYTQEKQGFAEAKLKRAGKEVAVLAISDVLNNPAAVQKFQTSSLTIAGYPAVQQGSMATALLVEGRYQVKVLSRDASFTAQDRKQWLEKFNLAGLAALQ
ncbi:hypothetical protein [Synechocystis sp. LKSZ1]|uniref:hypothetical protein n=1 Tax=Synechocystis sp. LKSZ1 TaxID=3144951 RepID=UPI00336BCDB3